jgi:hypothetical protein
VATIEPQPIERLAPPIAAAVLPSRASHGRRHSAQQFRQGRVFDPDPHGGSSARAWCVKHGRRCSCGVDSIGFVMSASRHVNGNVRPADMHHSTGSGSDLRSQPDKAIRCSPEGQDPGKRLPRMYPMTARQIAPTVRHLRRADVSVRPFWSVRTPSRESSESRFADVLRRRSTAIQTAAFRTVGVPVIISLTGDGL